MQTIILCGGLGTRLREETEFRPKPMVNVGNRPILWHIMKTYAHYSHTDFILALGYKGEMIRDYFINYEFMNKDVTLELGGKGAAKIHDEHDEAGWTVTLSDTGATTQKGGRLKRLERHVKDDTFLVTYGDGLSNVNLDELVAFHKDHGKMVTVTGVRPTARFGELSVDDENTVTSFMEKPEQSKFDAAVNGGFFVMNREIFDYLTEDEDCDLEYGAFEKIASEGQLKVFSHEGFWYCMDNVRDMDALNAMWQSRQAPWKIW